jgi:hypothetical protein
MKITVIAENYYQIEQFQKFFRWWVKNNDDKLLISFDCCPLSLFMILYHIKYDDKHNLKYLLAKYMPSYYQTYQILKFFEKNFKKIRNGKIVLFSTYTLITDISEIIEEYESIYREKNNMNHLDDIDLALLDSCNMIYSFLKTYKLEGKDNWIIFNDYQRQSSIIMSKLLQNLARERFHLIIYTNFLNAYYQNLNINGININFKSLVSYWLDRFNMNIIYLLGKEGEYFDFITQQEKKISYKLKQFQYQNTYLQFLPKHQNANIDYLIFKKISVADKIKIELTSTPKEEQQINPDITKYI